MTTPAANPRDEQRERERLLAEALDDFPRFCASLIFIVGKDKKRKKLRFNTIQRRYNEARSPRDVLVKSRQVGMTTLELARDVWKFVGAPGERVIVLCQSQTDHQILNKLSGDIQRMLDGLRYFGVDLPFETESRTSWVLPKRDSSLTIVEAGASEKAAQKKGRGGTFTRVHATEVATWEFPQETLQALLEAVPKAGTEVVFESTPKGIGNYFHDQFVGAQGGRNGYRAHFFPWFVDDDCWSPLAAGEVIEPETKRERELAEVFKLPPERIKFFRQKLAENNNDLDKVDEEYPTDPHRCFLSKGKLYFDRAGIDAIVPIMRPAIADVDDLRRDPDDDDEGPSVEIEAEDLQVYERPESGRQYVFGVDPAEGLGEDGDDTCGTGWDRKRRRHVATLRNKLDSNAYADQLVVLARHYNNALIAVERNKGIALIRALERLGYANIYYDPDDGKPGIATTTATRPVMLEELNDAIRDGSFHTDDDRLVQEMRAFVRDPKTGRPFAPGKNRKQGIGDDGIFSVAIAWRAMLVAPSAPGITTGGERGFSAAKKSRWGF